MSFRARRALYQTASRDSFRILFMHDFIVKRAVDFVTDLLLHSLRAPAKNARHFYSCFQACILPPNFLTGSLKVSKLRRCMPPLCDLWRAAWPRCTEAAMLRKGAEAHHLAACPRSCVSDVSEPALTCISMLACARCQLVAVLRRGAAVYR